jgi:hypothetical protein
MIHYKSAKMLRANPMRISNKNRFPVGIDSNNAAPTPATFARIVGDDSKYFI